VGGTGPVRGPQFQFQLDQAKSPKEEVEILIQGQFRPKREEILGCPDEMTFPVFFVLGELFDKIWGC
jgi:hypothetical protein